MKDTSLEVEQRYQGMLMRRSREERLKMGCSMHAGAQALVKASVLHKDPHAPRAELRRAFFLGFYSDGFPPDVREKILLALER